MSGDGGLTDALGFAAVMLPLYDDPPLDGDCHHLIQVVLLVLM